MSVKRTKSMPCRYCHELIRVPVPRPNGEIVCEDCWEGHSHNPLNSNVNRITKQEIEYHGDRFNSGEW